MESTCDHLSLFKMILLLRVLNFFSPYPVTKLCCFRLPVLVVQAIGTFFGIMFNIFTLTMTEALLHENEFLMLGVTFALTWGKVLLNKVSFDLIKFLKKSLSFLLIATQFSFFIIFTAAVVKRKENHKIYCFFIRSIRSKEIQIRTTRSQKLKLSFMFFIVIYSVISQFLDGLTIFTRGVFVVCTYNFTMCYVVNVVVI